MGHHLPNATDCQIAILAAGEVFGGAERQILTLLGELSEALSAPPLLIAFHDAELARQARDKGVPVHVLGARGVIDIKSAIHLRRILQDRSIHAISLHGYRAAVYLALSAAGLKLRVVKTEHGRPENPQRDWFLATKTNFFYCLENVATRHLNAHVAYVTADLALHFAGAHHGLQTSVIYNGVEDPHRLQPQRPPEYCPDEIVLAVVGRLEHVKGVDIAIRALANPETPANAKLHLVGEGPDRQRLASLAEQLSVADRVKFVGFRSNAHDYIAHADILLMPSRHEGLPYTLLEALALGTPVIASRVGGLGEVLGDQEAAILVSPDAPGELSSAIGYLASDRSLREKLASNGALLVQEKFTARKMAENYCNLLCDPIRRGAAKVPT